MCTCNALLEIMKDDLDARERQGEERGKKEGKQLGETRINELNRKLIALDRINDMIRSTSDPVFQRKLFKEFGL